jgi:hypothetical protein
MNIDQVDSPRREACVKLPSPEMEPSTRAPNMMALVLLLAVAAGLRIWVANVQPNMIWADEIYQVVEPAHRLVYGTGLIAWEYVVGMRSWIFPGVIAAVLWLGRLFGSDPAFKLIPVQLFMVLSSLVPVGVAYRWGERLDGLRGGLIVGGFVALWVDLLYFAPHPLSDVIAGDVLMAGLYAALPLTTRPGASRLAVAGALFGLTFVLRMQLGPALLVAAIFACGRSVRAWRSLIAGGALVLLASGSLDWITLGTPFQSIWLNVWLNIVKGVSTDYGTMPAAYYFIAPTLFWGFLLSVPIVCQFLIGSRCFPALFVVVITIFLTQSIIPHKEWRFIFPALPPFVTLCGIAVIQEIRDIGGRRSSPPLSNLLAVAAVAIWTCVSLAVALAPSYRPKWTLRNEFIDAFALAARQPGLCAVDLANILWIETPGSAALPPGIPIYANRSADVSRDWAGYNVAVSDVLAALPRDRFRRLGCFSGSMDVHGAYQKTACVWRRDGGCALGIAKTPATNWPPFFTNAQGKPRLDRIQSYLPGRS